MDAIKRPEEITCLWGGRRYQRVSICPNRHVMQAGRIRKTQVNALGIDLGCIDCFYYSSDNNRSR